MGKKSVKLHLGCGTEYWIGYINCDIDRRLNVDKYFDLSKFPYPFKDNFCDLIEMHHVLEHLDNPLRVIEELWRISKPGATIIISVPHWSHFTSYGDFTHKRTYSSAAFIYFEKNNPHYYSKFADFKVISKKFTCTRTNALWANKIFNRFLNLSTILTELLLCKFIPVSQIIFELKVIKKPQYASSSEITSR